MNFVKRHAGKIILAALFAIIGAFIASIVSNNNAVVLDLGNATNFARTIEIGVGLVG